DRVARVGGDSHLVAVGGSEGTQTHAQLVGPEATALAAVALVELTGTRSSLPVPLDALVDLLDLALVAGLYRRLGIVDGSAQLGDADSGRAARAVQPTGQVPPRREAQGQSLVGGQQAGPVQVAASERGHLVGPLRRHALLHEAGGDQGCGEG